MSGRSELSSNAERQMERHPGRRWRIADFFLVSLALGLISQLQAEENQLNWKSLIIFCALALGSFYSGLQCYIRGKKLKARFSLSANPLVQMLKEALEPIAEHLHLELRKQPKQTHGYLSRALGTIPGVLLAMWGMTLVFVVLIASVRGIGLGLSNVGKALKHNNLGFVLYEKNDLDGAIAEFGAALRLDPALSEAHNNLGLALYAKHDLDGAIPEYREALRLSPGSARFHSNLSLVLYDEHDTNAGIEESREAVRLNPQDALAYNNLGLGLVRKRDSAAFDEFRRAYALAPNDPTIRANYEWTLTQSPGK